MREENAVPIARPAAPAGSIHRAVSFDCLAEKTRRIFLLYCGLVLSALLFSKIVLLAMPA